MYMYMYIDHEDFSKNSAIFFFFLQKDDLCSGRDLALIRITLFCQGPSKIFVITSSDKIVITCKYRVLEGLEGSFFSDLLN